MYYSRRKVKTVLENLLSAVAIPNPPRVNLTRRGPSRHNFVNGGVLESCGGRYSCLIRDIIVVFELDVASSVACKNRIGKRVTLLENDIPS